MYLLGYCIGRTTFTIIRVRVQPKAGQRYRCYLEKETLSSLLSTG